MSKWYCEICGEQITKDNFWTHKHNSYIDEAVYIYGMKPEKVEQIVMNTLASGKNEK